MYSTKMREVLGNLSTTTEIFLETKKKDFPKVKLEGNLEGLESLILSPGMDQ